MEKYTLSWDQTAVIVTVICLILFLGLFYYAYRSSGWLRWLLVILGCISIFLPLLEFPRYITKEQDKLVVHFLLNSKELPLENYQMIEERGEALKGLTRTFASGGYFGYWGKWKDSKGIKYQSYVMDRSKPVYELTPKDPNGNHILINGNSEWIGSIKTPLQ